MFSKKLGLSISLIEVELDLNTLEESRRIEIFNQYESIGGLIDQYDIDDNTFGQAVVSGPVLFCLVIH